MAVSLVGLVVVAVLCGMLVIGVIAALAMVKGKPAGSQVGPECPNCGGWTVPQANYCQWCGKALGTAPGAR